MEKDILGRSYLNLNCSGVTPVDRLKDLEKFEEDE